MKNLFHFSSPLLASVFVAATALAADKVDLSNHNQKINYALGLDIVSEFQLQQVDIDLNAFAAGMQDALAGKSALTPDEQKAALKLLADQSEIKAQARWKVVAAKNLEEGEAFLAANKKKPGVKTMEAVAVDGSKGELQYEILKSGTGASPKDGDTVEVHYVGTLINGKEFDNSIKRNTPATFGMHDVIPGWTAALKAMKRGDKWRLFIPAQLGYREYGLPGMGPNAALIYEVELLDFFTPKPEPAPAKAN